MTEGDDWGDMWRSVKPIACNLLIVATALLFVEANYLNTDMCKFESTQNHERRAQSVDPPRAYSKQSFFLHVLHQIFRKIPTGIKLTKTMFFI